MRRLVVTTSLVAFSLVGGLVTLSAADQGDDSPKAAATRQLLKTKVSVDYKDTTLTDVIDDLKEQIKDKKKKTISVLKDNKGGVSNNTKFTYKADDKAARRGAGRDVQEERLGLYRDLAERQRLRRRTQNRQG